MPFPRPIGAARSRARAGLAALVALASLLLPSAHLRAAEPMPVVASFTILADLVRQVGGNRVAVTSLVGPDGDAHGFSPTPADAATLAAARVVVVNGLGFEGWLDRLVKASGTRAAVITASRGVKPMPEAGGHGHGHKHGDAADSDPHAWQDVGNAKLYVEAIRGGLIAADPDGRADYAAGADRLNAELTTLDRDVRAGIAELAPDRRRIITSHDAFGYFARAYGLRVIAPAGVSAEADVSARDVARIIRQIKAERVPAIFLENVADPRLLERIAQESGARIGGRLYSDALSASGAGADTFVAMMRHNLATLRGALAPR